MSTPRGEPGSNGTAALADEQIQIEERGPADQSDRWTSRVVSTSALLLGANLAAAAGFFVAVLLLARGLDPSGRGAVAFITVTSAIVARFGQFGLGQATSVFVAQRPAQRPVLLSNILLFVSSSTALVAGITCGVLAALDAGPSSIGSVELMLLGLGAVASALLEACYAFLLGCSRFRSQAAVQGTAPWLYATLVAVLAFGPGLTIARAALVWTIVMSTGTLVLFLASIRGIGLGRPNLTLLFESTAFGLRAWAGSFSTLLNFRVDQVLMGFIATEATLGIYVVAVNSGEVLLYFPTAIALALIPVIARTEDALKAERTLSLFRAVILITLPAITVAAIVGPELLPIAFGTDYDGSVAPFLWLLPGAIGYVALTLFTSSLVASSAPGLASLPQVVALVSSVALDFTLIPRFGASGAAVAASLGFLAGGTTAALAYRRHTGFSWRDGLPRRSDLDTLLLIARQLLGRLRK